MIVCDDCKKTFLNESINIKTARMMNGSKFLYADYFRCPFCQKAYITLIDDDKGIELRKDVEKMRKRIKNNKGTKNYVNALVFTDMYKSKVQRLKNHQDVLMNKYRGTFEISQDGRLIYHD